MSDTGMMNTLMRPFFLVNDGPKLIFYQKVNKGDSKKRTEITGKMKLEVLPNTLIEKIQEAFDKHS